MMKKLFHRLEEIFKINWYATFRINFSKFKFNEAIRLPIWIYGKFKIIELSGNITVNCPIRTRLVVFGSKAEMINSYGTSQLTLSGDFIINGPFSVGQEVALAIKKGGSFAIGEGSYIGNHTKLYIVNNVTFGKWVRFTYDSQLVSTNFHYMKNMITGKVNRMAKKVIVVNDYCWIGNNSTIMPGSVLPEKSIVASHSLVNKDYSDAPHYPMIGGIPAKVIGNGKCRVFNPKAEELLSNFFAEHPEAIEYDATEMNIF